MLLWLVLVRGDRDASFAFWNGKRDAVDDLDGAVWFSGLSLDAGTDSALVLVDIQGGRLGLACSCLHLLYSNRPLFIYFSRLTLPTPPLFGDLLVAIHVEASAVYPARADVAGDREAVVVRETAYASNGI